MFKPYSKSLHFFFLLTFYERRRPVKVVIILPLISVPLLRGGGPTRARARARARAPWRGTVAAQHALAPFKERSAQGSKLKNLIIFIFIKILFFRRKKRRRAKALNISKYFGSNSINLNIDFLNLSLDEESSGNISIIHKEKLFNSYLAKARCRIILELQFFK